MTTKATSKPVQLIGSLSPLPDFAQEFFPRWAGDEGGFTGEQMRAYASKEREIERERCLRLAQHAVSCAKNADWKSVEAALSQI